MRRNGPLRLCRTTTIKPSILCATIRTLGRAYCEASEDRSDLETTISDLISGQYDNPVRVIAFNADERWAEDISHEIAGNSCAVLVLPVTICRHR